MSVQIRLLGRPGVRRDREDVELRGHKARLLFALLPLNDAPVSRDRRARMLFVDASDAAATLRWDLSHLRERFGVDLVRDRVTLCIPTDVATDVQVLLSRRH